ncbi:MULTISPECIES: hypothetical protein [unclassified Streptomyces]|uniref:hypothetical protein n=1 Tax=unclassified Streptomyces TaxID=2593676 RepID=UPI0035DB2947
MANFLDTQSDVQRFAALLDGYDRRLQALERSTQAGYTSIEGGGSLDIYDEDGTLKGSVGVQPDGGVALVPVNPAPPPTPTPPAVEAVLAGLLVGWDGGWDDSYSTPSDFFLVQVHVGPSADFAPDVTTQVATITAPLGGTVTVALEGYDTVWVRLVGANTAAMTGSASVAVPGQPRQAVGQDLIDGIVTEVKLAEDAVTEAKIALGAVGSAALAAGAVLEDKLAKAAVTLSKIADGAVRWNALGGALADGVTQRWIDAMGDATQWQVLSKGTGATWDHLTGILDAPTGQSVGRATGYTVVRGRVQVPYDPEALYRISARVRTTTASAAGSDTLYVGALGVAADGVTLVSRSGANTYSSAHYVAASNAAQPAASGWVTYVGYLRGRALPGAVGTGAQASDPRSPGVVHEAVRFVSPLLYLNFSSGSAGTNSGSGVMDVDAFTVEVLKTGVVDSTNLVVGSVTTAALATDSVTAGKVSADAIGAREIQAESITALELAAGSVNTDKILANAITAVKILAGAVTTEKLLALAVTSEKIASLAITTDKLSALSVTADKLAVNSVTATKIAAGVIDATHIKAGAIDAERLALGVDGNLVADPSFEGETSVTRAATQAYFSIDAPGFDSPKCLRIDCANATKTSRVLALGRVPAVVGTKMFVSLDYKTSTDWDGANVAIYVRWQNASGGFLGYSVTYSTDLAMANTAGAWARISGIAVGSAPAQAVVGILSVSSNTASLGAVWVDNAVIRPVLSNGSSGARAELSPQGLQLFDGTGEEAVALMTGRPNYLTFSTDGLPVATIDQEGKGGFQSLAIADELTVGGDTLITILDQRSRGIIAYGVPTHTVTATGTEIGYYELPAQIQAGRMYRIKFQAMANFDNSFEGEARLHLRDGGAASPTISSPLRHIVVRDPAHTGRYFTADLEHVVSGTTLGSGLHRFLLSFYNEGGPAGQLMELGLPTTGRTCVFFVEDIGPDLPRTGGPNTGGGSAAPPLVQYTKTYAATWSGSYSSRGSYNSTWGNSCYQGYYSSSNGMQASLIGFSSALASDLSGATIQKAEIYLYFDHWYNNSGGRAVIKAHGHTSRPSSFSCDAESKTVTWAKNAGAWVDITSVFDSTRWRGIALDPNTSGLTYYGRARGYGQGNPPKLKVTYTK